MNAGQQESAKVAAARALLRREEQRRFAAHAIDRAGGVKGLAALINVTYQAVQQWRARQIPASRVIDVSYALGWDPTPHQLQSDLYPSPNDGLPAGWIDLVRRANETLQKAQSLPPMRGQETGRELVAHFE